MPRMTIMPWKSPLGGTFETRVAPMNASEVFDIGSLIYIDTDGEAHQFPQDGTEAVVADVGTGGCQVGVAAFGPGQASAAAFPSDRVNRDWRTGNSMTTGALINYWPADQGTLFITSISLAAGGAAAGAAPNGADRGVGYQITYCSATTPDLGWGIELTAATRATDIYASIVDVFSSRKEPVAATADGTYFVFEIQTLR